MITLVAKDLRLSLDALRPIALLIGVFLLFGATTLAMPERLLPLGLPFRDGTELLIVLWTMLAYGSIALPVWIVHAIAQGDRAHGAASLAAAIPVSAWARGLARFAAMLGAASVPAVLLAVLAWSAAGADSRILGARLLRWWPLALDEPMATALLSLAAAVVAIVFAPSSRRLWRAIVGVHLFFLILMPALGLSMASGGEWTLARFGEGPHSWGPFTVDGWMRSSAYLAVFGAIAVGILVGLNAVQRVRSARYVRRAVGLGSIAAIAIAFVAPRVAFAMSSEKESAPTYRRWLATFASEEELLRTVERWGGGSASAPISMGGDMELLGEASRRVRMLSIDEQATHPLALALRAALRFDDDARAYEVYLFTPFDRMDIALDWATRFPQSLVAPRAVVGELYRRKVTLLNAYPPPDRNEWSDWAVSAMKALRAGIDEGLITAAERPAAEAAVRALADALRSEVRP
jgi:hypothetical protein